MFKLVCYDIRAPKRLREVAKICEQNGVRLQKSCFQVDVENRERYVAFMKMVTSCLDKKKDSLIIYSICSDCERLAITEGPNAILDPDRCVFL